MTIPGTDLPAKGASNWFAPFMSAWNALRAYAKATDDKTFQPRSKARPTAILFGTSIEAQNGVGWNVTDPSSADLATSARGWFNWFDAYLGQPFSLVRNAGVGGNTFAQMRARIAADVVAYPSDYVFIGAPANDWGTASITSATTIALFEEMVKILQDAGRRVVALTFIPRGDMDAAMKAKADDYRNYLLSIDGRRGLIVLDTFRANTDPATYFPLSGTTVAETPRIHYSEGGAHRVGRVAAEEFSSRLPTLPRGLQRRIEDRSIIGNPEFRGGTGWATSVAGGGTVTPTYGSGRATVDIAGMTAAGDSGIFYVENVSGGLFAAGDVVQLSVRLAFSGATPLAVSSAFRPFVTVRQRKADNSFGREGTAMFMASSQNVVPERVPESGEIVLRTPRITLEAGTDRLYVYLGWIGAAKIMLEFTELSITKVQ